MVRAIAVLVVVGFAGTVAFAVSSGNSGADHRISIPYTPALTPIPTSPIAEVDTASPSPSATSTTTHPVVTLGPLVRHGFSVVGSMSVARTAATATLLRDGRVLIAGGSLGDDEISSAELYDPATRTFTPTGSMRLIRGFAASVLLPDGRVLIAGGDWEDTMVSAEIYDPATGKFSDTTFPPDARQGCSLTLLKNGLVILVGGGDQYGNFDLTAYLYDPAKGEWRPTGSLHAPRGGHTATLLQDGRVLIAGGWDDEGNPVATAEVYDPKAGKFSKVGPMSRPRQDHVAALLRDGRVLIAGGWGDVPSFGTNYDSAEIFDPATNRFTSTGSMTTQRQSAAAVTLADGRVLVTGGYEDSMDDIALSSTELFDPKTGRFSRGPDMPNESGSATLTVLKDGSVLSAGGLVDDVMQYGAAVYTP